METKIKYLILVLSFLILIIILKEVILKPKVLEAPMTLPVLSKIDINIELLKNIDLKALSPFEKTSSPQKRGRENPFLEY